MALAAAGFNVARRQDWLLACAFAVVRLPNSSRRALAPVTDDTSESIQGVRHDRMFAEGLLGYIGKTRLVQSEMAGGATISNAQLRQPYLMNARLKAAPQAHGFSAIVDECKILPLITVPLAEMLLCRRNCERQQQSDTHNAKCPHWVAEERLPHRAENLPNELHLTPPGQDPGPARAAEPCADGGEHNQFEEKPGHDPVSQWPPGQITAQS